MSRDNCAISNDREIPTDSRCVTENQRTFLVTSESKDRLHRFIFPHMLQEEISNLAIIRELTPSPGSSGFFTRERGPQFDSRIAKVTGPENSADVTLG
jgi:hypothetical protein